MLKIAIALPLLLATLIAAPAFADPGSAQGGKAQPGERFRQARGEILRARLGLDEKKAAEVEKVLDKYAPERKRLRQAMNEQRKALRELLQKNSNDQAGYKRALDSLTDSMTKMNALRQLEQIELSKLMTPKQQAQLLQVMNKARRGMRGHGHPGKR
jgi:Spy/CpxP family protein refolding chaperone